MSTYDPYGRLIQETISSTTVATRRYVYAGPDIIAVADTSNNLATLITHGPGNTEPLALDSAATSYYLHADKIGSIKTITDSSGQVAERAEYAAYGTPIFSDPSGNTFQTSQLGNFYAITGAEWIGDADLSRHGERFLDVKAGSFISEEAHGFDGPNRYWYAADRPTKYVDRSGAAFVVDDIAEAEIILPPLIDLIVNSAIGLWIYEHLRPSLSKAEKDKPEEINPPAPAPSCSQSTPGDPNNDPNGPKKKQKLKLGRFKSAQKWANQMAKRGWTEEQIDEAWQNGKRYDAPNKVNAGNPAGRYVNPSTGRSIVVDEVLNEVLQVGGDAANGFRH